MPKKRQGAGGSAPLQQKARRRTTPPRRPPPSPTQRAEIDSYLAKLGPAGIVALIDLVRGQSEATRAACEQFAGTFTARAFAETFHELAFVCLVAVEHLDHYRATVLGPPPAHGQAARPLAFYFRVSEVAKTLLVSALAKIEVNANRLLGTPGEYLSALVEKSALPAEERAAWSFALETRNAVVHRDGVAAKSLRYEVGDLIEMTEGRPIDPLTYPWSLFSVVCSFYGWMWSIAPEDARGTPETVDSDSSDPVERTRPEET